MGLSEPLWLAGEMFSYVAATTATGLDPERQTPDENPAGALTLSVDCPPLE